MVGRLLQAEAEAEAQGGGGTQVVPFFPEIKAPPIRPEALFAIGPVEVTNSMLAALLAFVVLLVLVQVASRRQDRRPGRFQVAVEMFVGGLFNFAKGAGGPVGGTVFPLFATLLIWLLVNNWIALIPGFGQVIVHHNGESFPLFRAMAADYNATLGLALMVFFLIHIFGVRSHGIGYFAEFVNIPALLKGKPIDFIVGIFHTIGELAKVLSLSFRLFANIYGGEILIAVILGLAGPVAVIFYGLEVFLVAVIQSLIFGLLALIYISLAAEHAEHPGEAGEPAPDAGRPAPSDQVSRAAA
ncbi:MAG: F-type H+-transporting ATPase subunit a [Chloroflexota bacterium]|jgi:F-type H+-transporting ATPase subunit a|nr:F-type H+-transporting ATPase subunit a [Chloroflexota bacterium]